MKKRTPEHLLRVLMIRAWCESVDESHCTEWRFRIQDVQTNEQMGARNLDELIDLLRQKFGDRE